MVGILNWKILGFRYLVSDIAVVYPVAQFAATDPRGSAIRVPAFCGSGLGVYIVDPAMRVVRHRNLDELEL